MFLKRKVLNRSIQKRNRYLDLRQSVTYTTVMALVLENYPAEIKDKVLGLIRAKDYLSLLRWADSYGGAAHSTAVDEFAASQLVALIKKYPFSDPDLPIKAGKAAMVKFESAELRCARYNLKFRRINTMKRRDHDFQMHESMRNWIRHVIGDKPKYEQIYRECSFGPGASIGVHGQTTHMARKYLSQEWTCTPSALPFAVSALAQDHHVWELLLSRDDEEFLCLDVDNFRKAVLDKTRLVQHNKIVLVPKTALVDRTIAIEPLLNGYVQKGTDLVMRLLLKRVGLDLTSQEVNREYARLGSLPGQDDPFVTIDLSSASDSISLEVVRTLLPPDWFEFLNCIRSPSFTLDDEKFRRYHKFTSMGNGFCFPLETLIFASACAVVSKPKDFIVYGDDIIVRQSVANRVLKTLWGLGFRHNTSKTFLQGPFRESCGADWYAGRNVRPLNLDYSFSSVENLIKFHNLSLSEPLWCSYFSEVRKYLRELIPVNERLVRPYQGVVTGAFQVELDEFQSSPFSQWDRYTQSWSWLELEAHPVMDNDIASVERYDTVLMMAALRGFSSRSETISRKTERVTTQHGPQDHIVQLSPFAYRRKTTQAVSRKTYAGASSTWLPPTAL